MEEATIRSEQGVTLSLCLVSWIDFLLHFENYKQSTAGELSKESLVRQAQYENMEAFVDIVQNDEDFLKKWFEVEKKNLIRKRKKRKYLIIIEEAVEEQLDLAAWSNKGAKTLFVKELFFENSRKMKDAYFFQKSFVDSISFPN